MTAMTTPGDLVAFIAARLDEARARRAAADWDDEEELLEWQDLSDAAFAHARVMDPARVLRQVEGTRAMMIALGAAATPDSPWGSAFDIAARCTAITWSDHPDYRAEWGPHARRG